MRPNLEIRQTSEDNSNDLCVIKLEFVRSVVALESYSVRVTVCLIIRVRVSIIDLMVHDYGE